MMPALSVSVRTAAQMTEISETTIREAINKQSLPAFRVGRTIRIQATDLQGWIDGLVRVGSEDDA